MLRGSMSIFTTSDFTPAEAEWIRSHATNLTVAFDAGWLAGNPFSTPGDYEGLDQDILRLVEQRSGLKFRVLPLASREAVAAAEDQGQVDLRPALRSTLSRQSRWRFTQPYAQVPVVLLVRRSFRGSLDWQLMARLRIAVGHGYALDEFLAESYPALPLQPTRSDLDALLDLSVGDLDVVIIDLPTASRLIEKEGIADLRIAGRVAPGYDLRMAVRRELPELQGILEKALASIDATERHAVMERWLRFEPDPFYRTRVFWLWTGGAAAAALACLGAVLLWNRTLRRRVNQATAELARAHAGLERRVEERTRELADANRLLACEVQERRRAERAVLDISSAERKRIGRDLHDSLGQELAGISCLAETLGSRLEAGADPEAGRAARRIAELVSGAVGHARHIVRGLMPVEVVQDGLRHALQTLARETSARHGVDCRCEVHEPSPVYNNDVATNLYRIAQEAIANAIRHGGARRITVRLAAREGGGTLTVEDDGRGMPPAAAQDAPGMGLRTMRYRADLCGGGLSLEPGSGSGTRVVCTFSDTAETAAEPE
jgi:signal transduction histidine kinase